MNEEVETPVTSKGATVSMHIALFMRQSGFAISVIVAFITVARTGNLHDVIKFVASEDFVKMAGIVGALAFPAYQQWKSRNERKKLVTVLDRVDDSVGKVIP